MDLIRILFAILLPPLGVFLQEGLRKRFWINVLLTILGYIPGIVHAVYVIVKYDRSPRRIGREAPRRMRRPAGHMPRRPPLTR